MMIFNTRTGRLFFFSTEPRACSYLPARESVMLFADPNKVVDSESYGRLIDFGFRRSGDNVYRPHCRSCTACTPVRIPVKELVLNRSQRRNKKRNADLQISADAVEFTDEHLQLYLRYQQRRHDPETSDSDAHDQLGFLRSKFINTGIVEFRLDGELLMVAVIDEIPQGLSAAYTFYDPDYPQRGLGVYGVLALAELCRQRELPWLYLGYWIEECEKMNYKTMFRPLHSYQDGEWKLMELSDTGVDGSE
ncbi:MAG: arginyltransferase [Immundisolibacteraceae bacterium]|nr:arginyltransferase [Immundisolibacteraceae bacterium]